MGINTLLDFKNALRYLYQENYPLAAKNLTRSRWYRQVKTRGPRITHMIQYDQVPDAYITFAKKNFKNLTYPH